MTSKLNVANCQALIAKLKQAAGPALSNGETTGLSLREDLYLEALEIALAVLWRREDVERGRRYPHILPGGKAIPRKEVDPPWSPEDHRVPSHCMRHGHQYDGMLATCVICGLTAHSEGEL